MDGFLPLLDGTHHPPSRSIAADQDSTLSDKTRRRGPRASQFRGLTASPAPARPRVAAHERLAATTRADREPPRLRRTFSPLNPEREAMLRERTRFVLAADPRHEVLERRLL